MIRTNFQPYITVREDGNIDIDLSDCEVNSVNEAGDDVEAPQNDQGYSTNAEILDKVLYGGRPAAEVGTAQALRNLADYMERQEAPPTPVVVITVDDDGDASFACPNCGAKDQIVEQDTGIRWSDVHRAKLDGDILLITFAQNDLGEFEGDGYLCRLCGTDVDFPYEVVEDYV